MIHRAVAGLAALVSLLGAVLPSTAGADAPTLRQGAIEGAAEAGSVTVERVLTALKEPIGGAKVEYVAPRI